MGVGVGSEEGSDDAAAAGTTVGSAGMMIGFRSLLRFFFGRGNGSGRPSMISLLLLAMLLVMIVGSEEEDGWGNGCRGCCCGDESRVTACGSRGAASVAVLSIVYSLLKQNASLSGEEPTVNESLKVACRLNALKSSSIRPSRCVSSTCSLSSFCSTRSSLSDSLASSFVHTRSGRSSTVLGFELVLELVFEGRCFFAFGMLELLFDCPSLFGFDKVRVMLRACG